MKKLLDRFPVIAVVLLLAVTLAPMMATRDYSPSNELRYVSIVDEAFTEGNVFAFTNQGQDYADKPPFYFWLMMLCKLIFGEHNMYALTLLSFIPACVIIAVMDKWLRKTYTGGPGGSTRRATALMLATSGIFFGMTVFLRMDMLMIMWIVLALWTFWKMDTYGKKPVDKFLLPFYTFMALFTKGPVGVLVPPLVITVFLLCERRWKDIFKYLGLSFWGILALFCAIWFTGVYIDGGKEYLNNLLFHQTVDRAVNSFHHKRPIWYYAENIWGIMAPWCLATVPVIVLALIGKGKGEERQKPSKAEKFLALACIVTFVMLSAFSSKLSIYLAPVIPFAVCLFPLVVRRRGWNGWFTFAMGFAAVLATLIGIAAVLAGAVCIFVPSVPDFLEYGFLKSPLVLLAGAILTVGGIRALVHIGKDASEWDKPVISIAQSLLWAVFFISFLMPKINDYVGYGNICKLVPQDSQVYTLCVKRPENMDVYLGRDIYSYDKDIDTFLLTAPKEGTLIMPVSTLGKSDALMDFLEDQPVSYCGKYAVYDLHREVKVSFEKDLKQKLLDAKRLRRKSGKAEKRRARRAGNASEKDLDLAGEGLD